MGGCDAGLAIDPRTLSACGARSEVKGLKKMSRRRPNDRRADGRRMSDSNARSAMVDSERLGGVSGFTLIEVVVAIAIVTLMMAGAYEVFSSASSAFEAANRVSEEQSAVRALVGLIDRDVECAVYVRYRPDTGFSGSNAGFSFAVMGRDGMVERIGYEARDGSLYRLRWVGSEPDPDAGGTGPETLEAEGSSQKSGTDATNAIVEELISGVEASIRYFDRSAKSWTDEWHSGQGRGIPDAIKVVLTPGPEASPVHERVAFTAASYAGKGLGVFGLSDGHP